jgi:hypothetical protein
MSKALQSVEFLRHRKSAGRPGATAAANTASIQAAIDAVNAAGGGVVELPRGTINIAASTSVETFASSAAPASDGCLILRTGVYLRGQGVGVTTLKVDSNGVLLGLWILNPLAGGVSDLTLDASWNGVNGAGHAIVTTYLSSEASTDAVCKNLTLRDLEIKNAASYGIGVQWADIENLLIENVRIFNTGADGIDIKGRGTSGGNQPAIRVIGNYIKQIGMRVGLDNQAAIDVRGQAYIAGNHIEIVEAATPDGLIRGGIRLREPAATETYGGAMSRVVGNFVRSTARASTRAIFLGSDRIIASNNNIETCEFGFRLSANTTDSKTNTETLLDDNVVRDCETAVYIPTGVERAYISSLVVEDCINALHLDGENATVNDVRATDVDVFFRSSGTGNIVKGGRLSGSITTRINDTGSGNIVRDVEGVRTRSRIQSGTFAIDSTGVKTVTVAHALHVTPAIDDIVATVSSTTTTDQRLSAVEITAVDATNVTLKVYVSTASGTGGATAKLTVDTNTESL